MLRVVRPPLTALLVARGPAARRDGMRGSSTGRMNGNAAHAMARCFICLFLSDVVAAPDSAESIVNIRRQQAPSRAPFLQGVHVAVSVKHPANRKGAARHVPYRSFPFGRSRFSASARRR
jgi:hypothetical protein